MNIKAILTQLSHKGVKAQSFTVNNIHSFICEILRKVWVYSLERKVKLIGQIL